MKAENGPKDGESGDSGYNIHAVEERWQEFWDREAVYRFDPDSDKEPFTIDNPPRYASGPLHAGHAVHYTHIDFVARYQRMKGKNVMFPLCFDVNGMPIEVRVEKISLDDFLDELCNEAIDSMTGRDIVISRYFTQNLAIRMDKGVLEKSFLGILKRGGMRGHPESTKRVLWSLGSFERIHGNRKERLP